MAVKETILNIVGYYSLIEQYGTVEGTIRMAILFEISVMYLILISLTILLVVKMIKTAIENED